MFTNTQQRYVQIIYTEFYPDRAINVEATDTD